MNHTLYHLVKDAYANALENGEEIDSWPDDFVASDMKAYDADIEPYPYADVLECVIAFRKNR